MSKPQQTPLEPQEDAPDPWDDPDPAGDFHQLARLKQRVFDGYQNAEHEFMEHLADMIESGQEVDGTIVRALVTMYRRGSLKVASKGKRTEARWDDMIRTGIAMGFSDSQIADWIERETGLEIDPELVRKRRSRMP
jgi:hypothetical protein